MIAKKALFIILAGKRKTKTKNVYEITQYSESIMISVCFVISSIYDLL